LIRVASANHEYGGILSSEGDSTLDAIWRQIDVENVGKVQSQELLAATTERTVRSALLHGFPEMDMDLIVKKLHKGASQDGFIHREDFLRTLNVKKVLNRNLKHVGIYFEITQAFKRTMSGTDLRVGLSRSFPEQLGPLGTHAVNKLQPQDFRLPANASAGGICELVRTALMKSPALQALDAGVSPKLSRITSGYGLQSYFSKFSPIKLPADFRESSRIPAGACSFCFCHPFISDFHHVTTPNRTDPDVLFLTNGGFIYFDENSEVLQMHAVAICQNEFPAQLTFGLPQQWHTSWTESLVKDGRFHPITFHEFSIAGATEFAWLYPDEEIGPLGNTMKVGPYGGFAYLGSALTGDRKLMRNISKKY
jgi:hypothetical protein